MRNGTGRMLNVFILLRHPPGVATIRRGMSTWALIARCEGCGRPVPFRPSLFGIISTTFPRSSFTRPIALPIRHNSSTKLFRQPHTDWDYRDPTAIDLESLLRYIRKGNQPSQEVVYRHARTLYEADKLQGLIKLQNTLYNCYKLPMSRRQIRSFRYIYSMTITLLTRRKHVDFAIVARMCSQMNGLKLKATVELYNPILKLCLAHGEESAAQVILNEIMWRLEPTKVTYTILLDEAIKRQNWNAVMQSMDRMYADSFSTDVAIVSLVIRALCDFKAFDLALHTLNTIRRTLNSSELFGTRYYALLVCAVERRRRASETAILGRRKRRHKVAQKRRQFQGLRNTTQ